MLAASPTSEAWGEAKTLLAALDEAPDPTDARLRLRAVLRRVVESIHLLVVPRGRDRLAAVQVTFTGCPPVSDEVPVDPLEGGRYRRYLIVHRPAKSNGKARVEGGWAVQSLLHPDAATAPFPFNLPSNRRDLRDPMEAGWTVDYLEALPKKTIDQMLAAPHRESGTSFE